MEIEEEEEVDDEERTKWIRILITFYSIDFIICLMANLLHYFQGLNWLFIIEVVLAILTLIFVVIVRKDLKPLFKWESFTVPKALVYSFAAIMFSIIVNITIKWLNKNIFDENVYYYRSFRHLPYPRLGMILLVALLPAIFEELAYRGVILQSLFKIANERQAIFIAAFLFAVIHMSFISFFWLLPFAIWLGNIRWKEQTIWYGVLIHFCFNATACLFEFYELRLF
ncbi:MAG: type II CAAX endopeptidase family protein [Chitinophagaceae bacterium]